MVVYVNRLGRAGAERAGWSFGAVGRVVVERLLEGRGLVDVGLDRVGAGITAPSRIIARTLSGYASAYAEPISVPYE